MKNKIISLFLIIMLCLTFTSCGDDGNDNPEIKVTSISVVETSVPSQINILEVSQIIPNIKIKVNKSDSTSYEVNLNQSMITDYNKLSSVGTHTINISYEGHNTTLNLTIFEEVQGVVSLIVKESSIPSIVKLNEVNSILGTIQIEATYADGSISQVYLNSSMIVNKEQLNEVGNQELTISYEGKTTTFNLMIVDYYAQVVYPDGTPVNNVRVQWCQGELCLTPVKVNNQGIAGIQLSDGQYEVHLIESTIPEGYTYNPNIYITNQTKKDVKIELIELNSITSGSGTTDSPYLVGVGCYQISLEALSVSGAKYFSFKAPKSGKFQLLSLAVESSAAPLDPYLGFLGQGFDLGSADVSGNLKDKLNFSYEFEAVEGETYNFLIMLSSSLFFPGECNFIIIEK